MPVQPNPVHKRAQVRTLSQIMKEHSPYKANLRPSSTPAKQVAPRYMESVPKTLTTSTTSLNSLSHHSTKMMGPEFKQPEGGLGRKLTFSDDTSPVACSTLIEVSNSTNTIGLNQIHTLSLTEHQQDVFNGLVSSDGLADAREQKDYLRLLSQFVMHTDSSIFRLVITFDNSDPDQFKVTPKSLAMDHPTTDSASQRAEAQSTIDQYFAKDPWQPKKPNVISFEDAARLSQSQNKLTELLKLRTQL